jgi:hypothetical protein
MSLDKAIASGKEHRKQYRKAKAIDKTCRNHGSCPYCKNNRLHSSKVRMLKTDLTVDDLDDRIDTNDEIPNN